MIETAVGGGRLGRAWQEFAQGLSFFRIIVLVVVVGILLLVLYPVVQMLVRTVYYDGSFQFAAFSEVFSAPWLGGMLLDTAITVAVSGTLALALAALFAWLNERTDASFGLAGSIIPLVPLLVPHVAVAIGWTFLLSDRVGFLTVFLKWAFGWIPGFTVPGIYSWAGMIGLYTMFLMPYAYVIVGSAFKNIDPALEEASRVSGASVTRTAIKVSLPLVLPAILGAGLLLLIEGLSLYSAPVIIAPTAGIDVLSVRMVRMLTVNYPPNVPGALVLATILLIVIMVAWLSQRRVLNSGNFAKVSGRSRADSMVKLGFWRWPARGLVLLYMLMASVLPLGALILVSLQPFWTGTNIFANLSFQHYARLFEGDGIGGIALRNSIFIGIAGATIGMVLAAILALYIRAAGPGVGRFADSVSKFPAALPHILLAVGFLVAFGGAPFHLAGTIAILMLAYFVIYLPQASIAASVAAGQVGSEMAEASAMCKAGGGRTFLKISLPLMSPGLIAGWGLLFVLMAGELTAASILANAKSPVVGFVILQIFESGSYGILAALASIVSLMSAVVICAVTYLLLRRTT